MSRGEKEEENSWASSVLGARQWLFLTVQWPEAINQYWRERKVQYLIQLNQWWGKEFFSLSHSTTESIKTFESLHMSVLCILDWNLMVNTSRWNLFRETHIFVDEQFSMDINPWWRCYSTTCGNQGRTLIDFDHWNISTCDGRYRLKRSIRRSIQLLIQCDRMRRTARCSRMIIYSLKYEHSWGFFFLLLRLRLIYSCLSD